MLLAALAIIGVACSDDNNRNMVPDSIYLHNAGVNEVTLYEGVDVSTDVVVIKAGKGFTGANVSLKVAADILAETDYELIPESCYSLDVQSLAFGKDDYQKSFKVNWDIDALKRLLDSDKSATFAIPFELVNNTASAIELKADKKYMYLVPSFSKSLVSFGSEINADGVYVGEMPVVGKLEDFVAYFPVSTNFIPREGLKYTIEIDESYVAKYNQEHGTNYAVLPKDMYSFETMDWEILPKQKIGYFRFTLHEARLNPQENEFLFGSYLLPIKLVTVSEGNINEDACLIPYWMEFNPTEVSRANWEILNVTSSIKNDPSFLDQGDDYYPEYLLDGKSNTCWCSIWSNVTITPLPYYFDFNMAATYKLVRVGIVNPSGSKKSRATFKRGHVEVSMDGKEWTRVGDDLVSHTMGEHEVVLEFPVTKASYLRFVIDEVYDYNNNPAYNGRCALDEIRAWCVN